MKEKEIKKKFEKEIREIRELFEEAAKHKEPPRTVKEEFEKELITHTQFLLDWRQKKFKKQPGIKSLMKHLIWYSDNEDDVWDWYEDEAFDYLVE